VQQMLTLRERFRDQRELSPVEVGEGLLQVANATVNQLGAARASACIYEEWMSVIDYATCLHGNDTPEEKSSRSTSPTRRPRVAASNATPQPVALSSNTPKRRIRRYGSEHFELCRMAARTRHQSLECRTVRLSADSLRRHAMEPRSCGSDGLVWYPCEHQHQHWTPLQPVLSLRSTIDSYQ